MCRILSSSTESHSAFCGAAFQRFDAIYYSVALYRAPHFTGRSPAFVAAHSAVADAKSAAAVF